MTINETIDGLQEIINRNQRTILPRVHIGYLIHAAKYLKEQKEEIENLKQTAQSMMEGICLLKEQEAVVPVYTTNSHPFHIGILYHCGNCHHSLIRDEDLFCRHCGKPIDWMKKAVKWE